MIQISLDYLMMLGLVTQHVWLFLTTWTCSLPGSSVHGDSPGKNTVVGCHALLQEIFPIQRSHPGLPHSRWIPYWLLHQRSPVLWYRAEKLSYCDFKTIAVYCFLFYQNTSCFWSSSLIGMMQVPQAILICSSKMTTHTAVGRFLSLVDLSVV